MFKEEATDRILADRAILSGILKNEFIPSEIKKFLIIVYSPTFKAIGAIAKFNLENPEEAQNAERVFWAVNKKAAEEKSSIVEDASDGLNLGDIEVFNKIMSLAHGFEYSSKPRHDQDFSMITPPIYTDSLDDMKQDMPIIKSLYEGLSKSYNNFYSKR